MATSAGETGTGDASNSPFRIALVAQYQLTTTDAHACTTPIQDSYAPKDHWQWMASLWRGCIGPDITIYIHECERDEVEKFGDGNPVENRLNDARTLIIRRAGGVSAAIEEKALRRVGFEVEEFLRK
jgi:HMG box factor